MLSSRCSCTKSTVTQVSIMFAERLNCYFTQWVLQLSCWFYIANLIVASGNSRVHVSYWCHLCCWSKVCASVSIRNLYVWKNTDWLNKWKEGSFKNSEEMEIGPLLAKKVKTMQYCVHLFTQQVFTKCLCPGQYAGGKWLTNHSSRSPGAFSLEWKTNDT